MAYIHIKPIYESGASRDQAVKLMKNIQFGKNGYLLRYDPDPVPELSGQEDAGIGDSYRDLDDTKSLFAINALVDNSIKILWL